MSAVQCLSGPVQLQNGQPTSLATETKWNREGTMAYQILRAHEQKDSSGASMHITFDALISHDITYVGIIQTAKASGMTSFPVPYVLTNCHNSLCAVGGTINEDDHVFGLSAAKKYGGIYVPANQAVIHQYAREMLARCGAMILGSDSHTRYGCFGTLGVGEGGGELVKQLLKRTWDIESPPVILVWLEGSLPKGVGPQDVALALVAATFPSGFVKNAILEFDGPGLSQLSMDTRTGIDVMTTETSCLSSIWRTDDTVQDYYRTIGRPGDYSPLAPKNGATYDGMVRIQLDKIPSMIALPFHPSYALPIHELQHNPKQYLQEAQERANQQLQGDVQLDLMRCIAEDGTIRCDQGIIVGCSGGLFENLSEAADILRGHSVGNGSFQLSVYPSSAPIQQATMKEGILLDLLQAGAVCKPCFCGPCFGAGDTPANNTLSIRHATRNFPNREGSRPGDGQLASVALMDARSIAATAANGGVLTAATDLSYEVTPRTYHFDPQTYEKVVYNGYGKPQPEEPLRYGPNIADWPEMAPLKDHLLVKFCAVIQDPVTTTDELIPSGETSSLRSNPIKLAQFALSRRVPEYVANCKATMETPPKDLEALLSLFGVLPSEVSIGSALFAQKPGDGSAREQAASCQKVLGGLANVCYEYATKRYRSNCINWGILPFTVEKDSLPTLTTENWLWIANVRSQLLDGAEKMEGILLGPNGESPVTLTCSGLTEEERQILADGCLINHYAK